MDKPLRFLRKESSKSTRQRSTLRKPGCRTKHQQCELNYSGPLLSSLQYPETWGCLDMLVCQRRQYYGSYISVRRLCWSDLHRRFYIHLWNELQGLQPVILPSIFYHKMTWTRESEQLQDLCGGASSKTPLRWGWKTYGPPSHDRYQGLYPQRGK